MSREERRKQSRLEKKEKDKSLQAMRWIYSLPPEKQELVRAVANDMSKTDMQYFVISFDRCIKAAIIDEAGLELKTIDDIIENFNDLIINDRNALIKSKEECGGNINMAVKKMNAKTDEAEALINELLVKGIADKELKEIVAVEFPTLSKAMITNAVKKVKTRLAKERKVDVEKVIEKGAKVNEIVKSLGDPDVDTKEALEYIFDEDYSQAEELTPEQLDKEIVENNMTLAPAPFGNSVPAKVEEDDFEVLKEIRIVDLKGKMASYHVENKCVEVNKVLSFTNVSEVGSWENEEISVLLERIEAIKDQAKETIKVINKYL